LLYYKYKQIIALPKEALYTMYRYKQGELLKGGRDFY